MSVPVLPQQADTQNKAQRARDLFAQRQNYTWVHTPGQPPYCKGVPSGEAFTRAKTFSMTWDVVSMVADLALSAVIRFGRENDRVRDFRRYYPLQPMPGTAGNWENDREFARQRLDGINPFMITLAREIPEKFPVTDATLSGVLPEGESLARLLDERRLFLVDYAALNGFRKVLGRFQVAPIALFWRDREERLMPLAIQLGQSSEEAPVIFTPADDRWLWLLARTHLQCADGTYHEVVAHLTRTHLVMETFWVAAARTLPPQHPLYVLLRPHFTGTIQINNEARGSLLAPGGPIDNTIAVGAEGALTLVGEEYARWSFEQFDPVAEMERRGVLDPEVLPHYHYRDDALALHAAILAYVETLLRVFYVDDEAVRQDDELQAWIRELTDSDGGRVKGMPVEQGGIHSVEALQRLLTQILFLCSVEHAAVNNGQYDQFGYIPNTPGALYLPPPTDRSPRSEANFVYALPPAHMIGEQILMVHLLSDRTLTPLGSYPEDFFVDVAPARRAVDGFRADLERIQREIDQRNQRLEVPYRYLDPPVIGRSIAI